MGGHYAESPAQRFAWDVPPDVRLCGDAPVSAERLDGALAWWRRLGFRFGEVERVAVCTFREDGTPLDSSGRVATLAVTVVLRGQLAALGLGGETDWSCYGGVPLWVVISLPGGLEAQSLVLEHELGHALGLGHHAQDGHVMNPVAARLGIRVDGITPPGGPASGSGTPAPRRRPRTSTWRRRSRARRGGEGCR